MKKIITILEKIEDWALIMMFVGMVGIIFVQVIMRFIFNNSLVWSEELGKFLFVWLSWIGISIGHRRKEHIRITLFIDRFSPRIRLFMEALSELILILICSVTVYYGVIMMIIQWSVPYAGIKISPSWGYLSLVLGCFIMIIRAIVYFYDDVNQIIHYMPVTDKGEKL